MVARPVYKTVIVRRGRRGDVGFRVAHNEDGEAVVELTDDRPLPVKDGDVLIAVMGSLINPNLKKARKQIDKAGDKFTMDVLTRVWD